MNDGLWSQFVDSHLLLGIAHLFRLIERVGEVNPTVRAVSNPMALRGKVDLVAFIRVPDRFAAPIHGSWVSRAKEGSPDRPSHFQLAYSSQLMTSSSSKTKYFSGKSPRDGRNGIELEMDGP